MIKIETKEIDKLNKTLIKNAEKLVKKGLEIDNGITVIIARGANDVRNTMIQLMQKTPRAPWFYMYKKKKHHPSLPLNPPATRSGELVRSIMWNVNADKSVEVGVIGGTKAMSKDGKSYAVRLEEGTTKMIKRPLLKPAVDTHIDRIKKEVEEYTNNTLTVEGME